MSRLIGSFALSGSLTSSTCTGRMPPCWYRTFRSPDWAVLGSFGRVRLYKGIEDLLEAFRKCTDPDAVLVIAGEPLNTAYGESLVDLANQDSRVKLLLGFIEEQELAKLFALCDLV